MRCAILENNMAVVQYLFRVYNNQFGFEMRRPFATQTKYGFIDVYTDAAKYGFGNIINFLIAMCPPYSVHTIVTFMVETAMDNGHLSLCRILCRRLAQQYSLQISLSNIIFINGYQRIAQFAIKYSHLPSSRTHLLCAFNNNHAALSIWLLDSQKWTVVDLQCVLYMMLHSRTDNGLRFVLAQKVIEAGADLLESMSMRYSWESDDVEMLRFVVHTLHRANTCWYIGEKNLPSCLVLHLALKKIVQDDDLTTAFAHEVATQLVCLPHCVCKVIANYNNERFISTHQLPCKFEECLNYDFNSEFDPKKYIAMFTKETF